MGNNKKVLVIDDDVKIRRVLDLRLRKAGYQVILAANGKEGLNLFKAEHPDMVITDILMPEKEGLETIMALRRESPEVKIIAMSGGGRIGGHDYLDFAKKFGAQYTFIKPFTGKEVLQAVRALLDNSPRREKHIGIMKNHGRAHRRTLPGNHSQGTNPGIKRCGHAGAS